MARLEKEEHLAAAYLLGSTVLGALRPDSDLDIALLPVHGRVIAGEDRLSLAERHLGVPQSNGEAFALLEKAGIISAELSKSLRGMAGFRNIAVHQYEELDMDVLRWVVETGHRDWIKLGEALGVSIRP